MSFISPSPRLIALPTPPAGALSQWRVRIVRNTGGLGTEITSDMPYMHAGKAETIGQLPGFNAPAASIGKATFPLIPRDAMTDAQKAIVDSVKFRDRVEIYHVTDSPGTPPWWTGLVSSIPGGYDDKPIEAEDTLVQLQKNKTQANEVMVGTPQEIFWNALQVRELRYGDDFKRSSSDLSAIPGDWEQVHWGAGTVTPWQGAVTDRPGLTCSPPANCTSFMLRTDVTSPSDFSPADTDLVVDYNVAANSWVLVRLVFGYTTTVGDKFWFFDFRVDTQPLWRNAGGPNIGGPNQPAYMTIIGWEAVATADPTAPTFSQVVEDNFPVGIVNPDGTFAYRAQVGMYSREEGWMATLWGQDTNALMLTTAGAALITSPGPTIDPAAVSGPLGFGAQSSGDAAGQVFVTDFYHFTSSAAFLRGADYTPPRPPIQPPTFNQASNLEVMAVAASVLDVQWLKQCGIGWGQDSIDLGSSPGGPSSYDGGPWPWPEPIRGTLTYPWLPAPGTPAATPPSPRAGVAAFLEAIPGIRDGNITSYERNSQTSGFATELNVQGKKSGSGGAVYKARNLAALKEYGRWTSQYNAEDVQDPRTLSLIGRQSVKLSSQPGATRSIQIDDTLTFALWRELSIVLLDIPRLGISNDLRQVVSFTRTETSPLVELKLDEYPSGNPLFALAGIQKQIDNLIAASMVPPPTNLAYTPAGPVTTTTTPGGGGGESGGWPPVDTGGGGGVPSLTSRELYSFSGSIGPSVLESPAFDSSGCRFVTVIAHTPDVVSSSSRNFIDIWTVSPDGSDFAQANSAGFFQNGDGSTAPAVCTAGPEFSGTVIGDRCHLAYQFTDAIDVSLVVIGYR